MIIMAIKVFFFFFAAYIPECNYFQSEESLSYMEPSTNGACITLLFIIVAIILLLVFLTYLYF